MLQGRRYTSAHLAWEGRMAQHEDSHRLQRQPRLLPGAQQHLYLLLCGLHGARQARRPSLHPDLAHGV